MAVKVGAFPQAGKKRQAILEGLILSLNDHIGVRNDIIGNWLFDLFVPQPDHHLGQR
jgi:hypothetical protein